MTPPRPLVVPLARLADGRLTSFLPVHVMLDLDVEAQILAPAVTYGITPDLDVNLTLPLIRTYLRAEVADEVPDPRLPQFTLAPPDPNDPNAVRPRSRHFSMSDDSVGVGDLLLRSKYIASRGGLGDVALALGLSLPTGDRDDLRGTGDTRVQPGLVVSRVFGERVEPLFNASIDLNADDVDRSVVHWAAGATAQVFGPLTGALVFLARHELEEQSDPIETPFFFQIERNDIFDVAIGARYLIGDSGVIAVNAIVPLNDEGPRPDVIPTVEIQYTFSTGS